MSVGTWTYVTTVIVVTHKIEPLHQSNVVCSARRKKEEYVGKESRVESQQSQPECNVDPGIEHTPHCWKGSAFATAPSLLSKTHS